MIDDGKWIRFYSENATSLTLSEIRRVVPKFSQLTNPGELGSGMMTVLPKEYNYLLALINEQVKHSELSETDKLDAYDSERGEFIEIIDPTLTGKWMFFAKRNAIEQLLEKIKQITETDDLPILLDGKIPSKGAKGPVIFYTSNCLNTSANNEMIKLITRQLELTMQKLRIKSSLWYYKPNMFSRKGIYSGNENLKSYIYTYIDTGADD